MVAAVWSPGLRWVTLFYNVVIIGLATVDVLTTDRLVRLEIARELSDALSVGTRNPITLVVRNAGRRVARIELRDEFPQPGLADPEISEATLQPKQQQEIRYFYTPQERGRRTFDAVYLRRSSGLGLWTLSQRRNLATEVRILPDIRAVTRYELMARQNRLEDVGIRMRRLRGQGSEFERLREYRRGDEMRQIDWKATSRQRELISREFNVEQNQNVLLAVDCGRSMLNESGGVSYLDRALNASIMLSYIALGQADNVGFLAFSSDVERSVKPVRGKPAIQTLLQHSFDLEAKRATADYSLAIDHISRRFRKRSLVIFVTHVIDEQHLDAICEPLQATRSQHLFLCVFLRDLGLTRLATRMPDTDLEAFQTAAAAELLVAIERKMSLLQQRGILTISTLPDQLTADVVNGYLSVKARSLI